jgi:hypothetical protein
MSGRERLRALWSLPDDRQAAFFCHLRDEIEQQRVLEEGRHR